MKVFVTGGTGFIGAYVVCELIKGGHEVTLLARNPEKIRSFAVNGAIETVQGSLQDYGVIERALPGKDACIHIALDRRAGAVDMLDADTRPSVFIFETAARLGVKKLIYTSSAAAMGEIRQTMDETTYLRPVDFYGAAKGAVEAYLLSMSHMYGITCNIIRPGHTFGSPAVEGAPMEPGSRFRDIVKKARENQAIRLVRNDGAQFIWAGNLARLYTAVLRSGFNRRIFIGMGRKFIPWEDIARFAVSCTGSGSEIIPEEEGSIRGIFEYDVSAMEKGFGFNFYEEERIREHVLYLAGLD